MVLIFLIAILVAPTPAHQLQIVDHHQRQAMLALQPAELGVNIHQVHAGGVVDE